MTHATPMPMGLLLIGALMMAGCSHTLEFTDRRLPKRQSINVPIPQAHIGITGNVDDPINERLLYAVAVALQDEGLYVVYPFHPAQPHEAPIDYVAWINASRDFHGSLRNFLVTWPGFAVFAPTWHGYAYRADFTFDVTLTDAQLQQVRRLSIPIDVNVRHADLGRTWTQLSWFTWGASAFVSGLVFTRYDQDITNELVSKAAYRVGAQVATEITAALSDVRAAEPSSSITDSRRRHALRLSTAATAPGATPPAP